MQFAFFSDLKIASQNAKYKGLIQTLKIRNFLAHGLLTI